ETGDLWIGDVGQNRWEEVDYQPAGSEGGENYGWNVFEGRERFRQGRAEDPVEPVIVYPLGEGGNCSVIAGFVYHGKRIPWLRGRLRDGDFGSGWIRAAPVEKPEGGRRVGEVEQLSSFGEDHDGKLYALSLDGAVYRLDPG